MAIINNTSVSIDTVVPTINVGEIMLSADRRSTKEAPLTDAERIRRCVLPANHWGDFNAAVEGERNQSLTDILREALKRIGSDRLRDELAAEPMLRTIELAKFTIPALLTWSNETAASRGSITFTRDDVTNWFKDSATAKALTIKHGAKAPAILAFLTNRFGALAAKNHGLKDEADALKLLSIIDPADTTSSLVIEVMGRLEAISKQLAAKAAEATVSMDDI